MVLLCFAALAALMLNAQATINLQAQFYPNADQGVKDGESITVIRTQYGCNNPAVATNTRKGELLVPKGLPSISNGEKIRFVRGRVNDREIALRPSIKGTLFGGIESGENLGEFTQKETDADGFEWFVMKLPESKRKEKTK
jgi:hypothetical protein